MVIQPCLPLISTSSFLSKGPLQHICPEEKTCSLPDVVDRLVCLGSHRQQDGLGSVLKQCRSVLSLALLDPVAVDLERAGVDELADGLDRVRVAHDHLLGDRLGAAVVAVDPHGGQHSHANDLMEQVIQKVTGLCLYV